MGETVQDDDLDDLLGKEDLEDVGSHTLDLSHLKKAPGIAAMCFPLYLAGPSGSKGCDKLRCLGCDFKVVPLPGYSWNNDVDYLFFRNNTPNLLKLKVKAKANPACNAYCCQCSWKTITALHNLSSDKSLRWVCGGHDS